MFEDFEDSDSNILDYCYETEYIGGVTNLHVHYGADGRTIAVSASIYAEIEDVNETLTSFVDDNLRVDFDSARVTGDRVLYRVA